VKGIIIRKDERHKEISRRIQKRDFHHQAGRGEKGKKGKRATGNLMAQKSTPSFSPKKSKWRGGTPKVLQVLTEKGVGKEGEDPGGSKDGRREISEKTKSM